MAQAHLPGGRLLAALLHRGQLLDEQQPAADSLIFRPQPLQVRKGSITQKTLRVERKNFFDDLRQLGSRPFHLNLSVSIPMHQPSELEVSHGRLFFSGQVRLLDPAVGSEEKAQQARMGGGPYDRPGQFVHLIRL